MYGEGEKESHDMEKMGEAHSGSSLPDEGPGPWPGLTSLPALSLGPSSTRCPTPDPLEARAPGVRAVPGACLSVPCLADVVNVLRTLELPFALMSTGRGEM